MKASRYNVWIDREDASYVYSGMTGGVLRVSHEEREAIERALETGGADLAGCSPTTLTRLAEARMIIPDDADELETLALRYRRSRADASRLALTIVTSLGCNFDCPYCFEDKHPSIMSEEVERDLVALVEDQVPSIQAMSVCWFGGEPLVGKRPLLRLSDAFIDRCDRAGVTYNASIVTNGYLLTEETARELRDRRVTRAQVCLDGPPDVHDRMRPMRDGRGTFWRIVENLRHAVDTFDVTVRMNLDRENWPHVEALLRILADEGFAGRVQVVPGQIVVGHADAAPSAPASGYCTPCFASPEFALVERAFSQLAARYGFAQPDLPVPIGAPCTAMRSNEFVVGSAGELYKCWESVGNARDVIGHVRDYRNPNGRMAKWLRYDPFSDAECSSCIALPVCMGGCAQHSFDVLQHENRCSTFRHTYREQVGDYVDSAARYTPVQLKARPARSSN